MLAMRACAQSQQQLLATNPLRLQVARFIVVFVICFCYFILFSRSRHVVCCPWYTSARGVHERECAYVLACANICIHTIYVYVCVWVRAPDSMTVYPSFVSTLSLAFHANFHNMCVGILFQQLLQRNSMRYAFVASWREGNICGPAIEKSLERNLRRQKSE